MAAYNRARSGHCGAAVALALAALVWSTGSALAQALPPSNAPPKWGASLDFEGRFFFGSSKRAIGEADLFVPLAQNDATLLFGDVRARLDDNDSSEGNIGLGLRHMLPSGWNLGVYGYFDRRRSEFDHHFNQATFGAEMLGRDWDLRANVYLPFGDRVKSLGATATAADPFGSLSGGTIVFVTPGLQTQEERALKGFDAEIGWRVPIWDADADQALRLYAGMYHFDDDVVKAVTGPRLRAELTMYKVPGLWEDARLTIGGGWQEDDARGSQGFAEVRLRIPLQAPGRERRLSAQERRMTDPVVRDVDIVTQKRTTQAPAIVEAAINATNGQAIGTATQLSSATTGGAALPGAITAAGANSVVILSGTFNTTTNVTTLQSGQTVMSGGGTLAVRNAAGRTATFTAPGSGGTIAGTVTAGNAATLEMATNSVVSGLTVTNTGAGSSPEAIRVGAISGATITNSTLTATRTAAGATLTTALHLTGASNITISGNTLTATTAGGAGSQSVGLVVNTASTNITVVGNTFNATGGVTNSTIDSVIGTSFVTAASTGNVVTNGGCNATATGSVSFTNAASCP